jgi:hypothetical protein
MVFYRLPFKEDWSKDVRMVFVDLLSENLKFPIVNISNHEGRLENTFPYIEVEEKEVRIRRLTNFSEEEQNKLKAEADKIYDTFSDAEKEWKKSVNDLIEKGEAKMENNQLVFTSEGEQAMKELISKSQNKIMEKFNVQWQKRCVLCGEGYCGYGNNALPLMEGRCCDKCNFEKVLPARMGNLKEMGEGFGLHSKKNFEDVFKELKNNEDKFPIQYPDTVDELHKIKEEDMFKEETDIDKLYGYYNVPPIDRLKNYQLLLNVLSSKVKTGNSKTIYELFVKPIIETTEDKRKTYLIENNLAEKILHRRNYPETLLPFPALIIDCALQIKNRFYFAFLCGRFYMNNPYTSYIGITTCFLEKLSTGISMNISFLSLEKDISPYNDKGNTLYNEKIRNFISGVLNFVHEPDVEEIAHPINPKNNQRRIERGRTPLPAFYVIKLMGKKKIYLEKNNKLPAQPKRFNFQQDVGSTYIHFRNKKVYRRLYAMDEDTLNTKGYSIYKGIIRKKRKEFTRFKNLPRRKVAYVLESDDVSTKIKVEKPKEDI